MLGLYPLLLLILVDAIIGDPRSSRHPIVLMGKQLKALEEFLFKIGLNHRLGGGLLFLLLAITWVTPAFFLQAGLDLIASPFWRNLALCTLASPFFALRSLIEHGGYVAQASTRNLDEAREKTSWLVGRDVSQLDENGCRRAAIESLSENFVDGILSPLFFFWIGGLPGLVLFKIISTMDSMVGYKNERYLHFGYFGARADDVLNFLPARISPYLLAVAAIFTANASPRKAVDVAKEQHHHLPSPNSGWSEASMAGALQTRLCGPIYKDGVVACELWIGDERDPKGCTLEDVQRSQSMIIKATLFAALVFGCLSQIF